MAHERILVIEDDANIQELLRYNLEREGFAVDVAARGEQGLKLARQTPPDLVLLDLMLPGMDGLEVCRELQSDPTTAESGILIISAKDAESDIVTGLTLGADDYLTKPFSPHVLLARIRAVLRRRRREATPENERILVRNGGSEPELVIHPGRFEVTVDGEPVKLTVTEFRVLHLLARRRGWVFTRYQIVNAVKGAEHIVTERSVDVQIVGLRRKLGDAGAYIETVRSVGYRFREE